MILDAHVEQNQINQKSGAANYVTNYDVRIQKFLICELSDILPYAGFYGKEDTVGNEHSVGNGLAYFINPIDGTTNFIFDYHNSCVSVGLGLYDTMIGGWVNNPYTDQMYAAYIIMEQCSMRKGRISGMSA